MTNRRAPVETSRRDDRPRSAHSAAKLCPAGVSAVGKPNAESRLDCTSLTSAPELARVSRNHALLPTRPHMAAGRAHFPSPPLRVVHPESARSDSSAPGVVGAYHSTKDLCARFRCSSRTLFRRMKRTENPFPHPCIRHRGSENLWAADDIAAWESRERELTRMSYFTAP